MYVVIHPAVWFIVANRKWLLIMYSHYTLLRGTTLTVLGVKLHCRKKKDKLPQGENKKRQSCIKRIDAYLICKSRSTPNLPQHE